MLILSYQIVYSFMLSRLILPINRIKLFRCSQCYLADTSKLINNIYLESMIDVINCLEEQVNEDIYDDTQKLRMSLNSIKDGDPEHTNNENDLTHEELKADDEFAIDSNLGNKFDGGCLFPANNPVRIKSSYELQFLEEQFAKDPAWSRKTVQICKKELNLRTDQVYKWGYDKKKRLRQQNGKQDNHFKELMLSTQQAIKEEIICCVDLNLYVQSLIDFSQELLPSLNLVSSSLEIQLPIEKRVTKEFGIKW